MRAIEITQWTSTILFMIKYFNTPAGFTVTVGPSIKIETVTTKHRDIPQACPELIWNIDHHVRQS